MTIFSESLIGLAIQQNASSSNVIPETEIHVDVESTVETTTIQQSDDHAYASASTSTMVNTTSDFLLSELLGEHSGNTEG